MDTPFRKPLGFPFLLNDNEIAGCDKMEKDDLCQPHRGEIHSKKMIDSYSPEIQDDLTTKVQEW